MNNTAGIRGWGLGIRRATGVTLAFTLLASTPLFAQNPADPTLRPRPTNPTKPTNPTNPTNLTNATSASEAIVAPIECWWKTDRSAVRVGEHFTLTLTCAVLETERVKVVVDESGLAPSALHLVPFDIVGGQRFRDIVNAPRRFFQYQYSMRVLGEEFFGREVTLPRLQISYRVQNSLQGGVGAAGTRDAVLARAGPHSRAVARPCSARPISETRRSIRSATSTRAFSGRTLLFIFAGVAFVLAGLMAVMLLARAAVKRRATAVTRQRTMSPGAVLRAASRELGAVKTASQNGGWNSDLAGRAAAALRLAGAVALSRPVTHQEVDRHAVPSEGQVAAGPGLGLLRGKRTVLSASVTSDTTALNGRSASTPESWGALSQALRAFTAVRYSRTEGREGDVDGTALDAVLAEGQDAVKRLRFAQWRRFGRSRRHTEAAATRQTWAR